jgi:hypothetical protein
MDTILKWPLTMAGVPLVFSGYEVEECYDQRGRFRLGKLRKRQEEKVLQASLLVHHGITTAGPEEVYRYVTPLHPISIVKARRAHWGYYLMTVTYRYRGVAYARTFRFVRSSRGGLSGHLYPNPLPHPAAQ